MHPDIYDLIRFVYGSVVVVPELHILILGQMA